MKRRLAALVVALASLFGVQGPVSRTVHASVDVTAAELQLIDLLNADRSAAGLPPLAADPRLMDVARWRSEDMVSRNFFGHDLGGFNVGRLLRERQIPFNLAGENLVSNTFDDASTVATAHVELMKSADHRQNVLHAAYNFVGVGVAIAPDRRTVYTQVFIQAPS